jgi:sensor domain CHASE-containing protein/two-component sensor histidine kinase
MSLRSKLVLILAGVIAAYGGIHYAVERAVVGPSFATLERHEAMEDLHRVLGAIQGESQHLDTTCHDWAAWDDTYDFVETSDPKYVAANLEDASLLSAHVDMMYFVRVDGTVAHRALCSRPDGISGTDPSAFPLVRQSLDDPLRCVEEVESFRSGMMATPAGPLLVASRPIVKSSREGPIRGYLVLGRLLDRRTVATLSTQTRVHFRLWDLDDPSKLPPETRAGLQEVTRSGGEGIVARDEKVLPAFAWLRDLQGMPAYLVQAEIPRDLMNEVGKAIAFALWSTVGAGVLVLCVLTWLLQAVVVDPLATLTAHAVSIGRDDDLDTRLGLDRADEIGVLSREIDRMCDDLAQSRARLVASAHRAGMSQVAADVIHNVGNVLNSTQVSAHEIDSRLKSLELDDLDRVATALGSPGEPGRDPQEVLAYLSMLSKRLGEQRQELLRESADLAEGLQHVHELVRTQQDLAGGEDETEVSIAAEIETAIRISRSLLGKEVEFVRDFADLPRVRIQKHRLLQILVNLLKNARESVEAAGIPDPRILLRLSRCAQDTRFRIEVRDNGVGIPEEGLALLFSPGHTTKERGHGIGLHASANAARELGGSLEARSEGVGRGATFSLELPLPRQAVAA